MNTNRYYKQTTYLLTCRQDNKEALINKKAYICSRKKQVINLQTKGDRNKHLETLKKNETHKDKNT